MAAKGVTVTFDNGKVLSYRESKMQENNFGDRTFSEGGSPSSLKEGNTFPKSNNYGQ